MQRQLVLDVPEAASALDILSPNWFEKIDFDTLDMNEPFGCILGQIFKGEQVEASHPVLGMVMINKGAYQQDWFEEYENFFTSGPFGFKTPVAEWKKEVQNRIVPNHLLTDA